MIAGIHLGTSPGCRFLVKTTRMTAVQTFWGDKRKNSKCSTSWLHLVTTLLKTNMHGTPNKMKFGRFSCWWFSPYPSQPQPLSNAITPAMASGETTWPWPIVATFRWWGWRLWIFWYRYKLIWWIKPNMAQQWTLWTLELVHLQVAIHQHQAASLRDLLCIPGSKFRLASSIPSPQLQYQLCRQYLPRLQNFELDLLLLHKAQMALHLQVALHHQHHQW